MSPAIPVGVKQLLVDKFIIRMEFGYKQAKTLVITISPVRPVEAKQFLVDKFIIRIESCYRKKAEKKNFGTHNQSTIEHIIST